MSRAQRKDLVYGTYAGADHGFVRLSPPHPGEWLSVFDEPGQTFDEYVASTPHRKTPHRHTIYLQPLGTLRDESHALLEAMREYAAAFFVSEAELLEPTALPPSAYNHQRHQYDAQRVLAALAHRPPTDALALIGVTMEDLYVPDLNFVFGLGSLAHRVGVYSLARYALAQTATHTLARRALKVMNHETGHILGLSHCIFYKCTYNGSNSLAEADRRPIHACPLCRDKLRWALGFHHADRYERLAPFYEKHAMADDAAFCREQATHLRAHRQT